MTRVWEGDLAQMQEDALFVFESVGESATWKRPGHADSPKTITVMVRRAAALASVSTPHQLERVATVFVPNHDSIGLVDLEEGDTIAIRLRANDDPRDCRVTKILNVTAVQWTVEVAFR